MSLKAIVFDMDGVLIDSQPYYDKGIRSFFNKLGLPYEKNELTALSGLNVRTFSKKVLEIYPDFQKSQEETEAITDKIITDALMSATDLNLIDGVLEFIQAFHKAGLKIAIASSSSFIMVNYVVKRFGLDRYINTITTGDEVNKGKPDPDIYLISARRLGVSPSECIAFEDSPNGIKSAKAAGMVCGAFSGTNHHGFDQSLSDFQFERFDKELLNKILSLI